MKKSLMRAALVACLPFCAMAVTAPALAADSKDAPKVSKAVSKPLADCKKALDAKDYPTAIAKCSEARAIPEATDYDKYLSDRFIGVAYFSTNDRPKAAEAFYNVVTNPTCPEEDRATLIGPAMSLAAEQNNNARVIELGQIAVKSPVVKPDVYGSLASAYYTANDSQNAILYANKGIDLAKQQGVIPQYGLYQILTFSYDKLKDRANEVKGFELMAGDYGKPEDWRYYLDFSLEMLPGTNKPLRQVAALHMYRLRSIVNATWQPQNYAEAADVAHALRIWGEKRDVLETAVAKGLIPKAKVAQDLAQTISDAKKDEPILPTVEKSSKDAKSLANVAEAYYGYGRYADAARTAQKAIDAGGPYAAEAKLVLAEALIKQGNEAGAKAALANFQGDPALARVAQIWNVYLNRRYTTPAQ